jgi:H+-translocating NAD(P) transhydrogenase subunit alpha
LIWDRAADQGGNCALTEPNRAVEHAGVIVVGARNLPALVPADASQLYARSVVNLFRYLYPAHGAPPDATDEIVRSACVTRDGAIVSETVRAALPKEAAV